MTAAHPTDDSEAKQPTTPTGRVIPTSEQIAKEIDKLIREAVEPTILPLSKLGVDALCEVLVKPLAAHLLQRIYDDHWPTLKQGMVIGRKEALVMLEALRERVRTYVELDAGEVAHRHEAIPLSELDKVIAALGANDA